MVDKSSEHEDQQAIEDPEHDSAESAEDAMSADVGESASDDASDASEGVGDAIATDADSTDADAGDADSTDADSTYADSTDAANATDADAGDGETTERLDEPVADGDSVDTDAVPEKSSKPKKKKAKPPVEVDETEDEIKMDWYILKVQSNRENSICDGLKRRVAVAGLDAYFGEILVPTEDVAEFKNGKRRVVKRKLYPGYIVVHMDINDDTWFLVRETPGIGDFTGAAGKPSPMLPHEVTRIVKSANPEEEDEPIKTAIPFKVGDRVRIKEGTFENFEGDVEGIDEANGRVTVMINIFGRSTPVELEHWQIESV